MHPVTFQVMNEVEKYNRTKQREAYQLMSKAQTVRPGRPDRIQKLLSCLGGFLVDVGQWLVERHVAPDHRSQGQVPPL
jgi:hypothetical protein